MEILSTFPPFVLDIYDYDDDLFDKEPDFLCRSVIDPRECNIAFQRDFEKCEEHDEENCPDCIDAGKTKDVPSEPKWHPCKFNQDGPKCGEILVSFAVSFDEFEYPVPYE